MLSNLNHILIAAHIGKRVDRSLPVYWRPQGAHPHQNRIYLGGHPSRTGIRTG